jgi:hypothetical protein
MGTLQPYRPPRPVTEIASQISSLKCIINVRFEVFTTVTMKNGVFWDVTPCALVRTDILEERSASFIRMTRIGELGTTLTVTSNRRTLPKKYRIPPKLRFHTEPHGVTSHKTPFCIINLHSNLQITFEVLTAAFTGRTVFWPVR